MLTSNTFNILYIADIVGQPGMDAVAILLRRLVKENQIDFIIANGENAAAGKGMTPKNAKTLFDLGVNVITSGNHIWYRDKLLPDMDSNPHILRPINYPESCPGHGSCVVEITDDLKIGVINAQGRSFMYNIDCPFNVLNEELNRMKTLRVPIKIIDFHAEATAEKIALARHLDGKASALIGSHTHVQTADEQILPGGMAYITDAGMTGPFDSVIGMDTESAIKRFRTQLPVRYKIAQQDKRLNGVTLTVDKKSGKSIFIKRIMQKVQ